MEEAEKIFIKLAAIGGLIALAKLLVADEKITFRLLVGRVVLGSALALSAGVFLIQFEKLHELALIGIACTLGISGQTGIEWWMNRNKQKNEIE